MRWEEIPYKAIVYPTTKESQLLPEISAAMALLKKARTVTVGVLKVVAPTVAAILPLASLPPTPCAILPTMAVVAIHVNSPPPELYVGRRLVFAIHKRLAPVRTAPVPLITQRQMAQSAATTLRDWNAPAASVLAAICNAKHSWAAILQTTIPTLAILRHVVCRVRRLISDQMSAIRCSRTFWMARLVVEVASAIT